MSERYQILVVEHRMDPDIERALRGPGASVRFAGWGEALDLATSLLPNIIILDSESDLGSWRLIAEIWKAAKKGSHSPAIILLADEAARWQADRFGPVRFSDRRHLREVCQEVILTASHHGSSEDLEDEAWWEGTRDRMWTEGNLRFSAEQERMRKLGIVDERGGATLKEWPVDMGPGSSTDVAT